MKAPALFATKMGRENAANKRLAASMERGEKKRKAAAAMVDAAKRRRLAGRTHWCKDHPRGDSGCSRGFPSRYLLDKHIDAINIGKETHQPYSTCPFRKVKTLLGGPGASTIIMPR